MARQKIILSLGRPKTSGLPRVCIFILIVYVQEIKAQACFVGNLWGRTLVDASYFPDTFPVHRQHAGLSQYRTSGSV